MSGDVRDGTLTPGSGKTPWRRAWPPIQQYVSSPPGSGRAGSQIHAGLPTRLCWFNSACPLPVLVEGSTFQQGLCHDGGSLWFCTDQDILTTGDDFKDKDTQDGEPRQPGCRQTQGKKPGWARLPPLHKTAATALPFPTTRPRHNSPEIRPSLSFFRCLRSSDPQLPPSFEVYIYLHVSRP